MKTRELSNYRRTAILLVVGIALLALTACGGGDEDAPTFSTSQSQASASADATPEETDTSTLAPPAASIPEPPEAAMVPATIPEPGSDEEQIMATLEKQVRAVNSADYKSFLETCTPSAKKPPTVKYLKYVYEERRGVTDQFGLVSFSPQGYNVRNVEVKLLRAPFAEVKFEVWDYDHFTGEDNTIRGGGIGSWVQTYEKVDDQWYSEVAPC